jgi:hypothetical protein
MKIIVKRFLRLCPFRCFYTAENKPGKDILKMVGKKFFSNSDLYALQKLGFEVEEKKKKHK